MMVGISPAAARPPRPSADTSASGIAARSVTLAQSQLGVLEVTDNKGPRVVEYQKSVKFDRLALNEPWCASFVTWVGVQANDPTPLRSSSVKDWVRAARTGTHGMSIVPQNDVRIGDLVALSKSGKWEHIGIVAWTRGGISVISGNTTSLEKHRDGVFEKPLTNWTNNGMAATFLRNAG